MGEIETIIIYSSDEEQELENSANIPPVVPVTDINKSELIADLVFGVFNDSFSENLETETKSVDNEPTPKLIVDEQIPHCSKENNETMTKENDDRIPKITMKSWKFPNTIDWIQIIKYGQNERIAVFNIIDVLQAKLWSTVPTTLFEHKETVFAKVQIKGTVTSISRDISTKCAIVVDDGTGAIRVVLDNSFNENKYRQDVKMNMQSAKHALNAELVNSGKLSANELLNPDRKNYVLSALAYTLAKGTDEMNTKVFPNVKDLNLADKVTVNGRLVEQTEGRYIYGFNMRRKCD